MDTTGEIHPDAFNTFEVQAGRVDDHPDLIASSSCAIAGLPSAARLNAAPVA